jgi:non-heme chloroperoxidase
MTTITQPGSLGEQKPTEPMTVHTVQGGGGLRLHVREWGRPDGPPILLIHGISASHLCWARQYQSKLAKEFRLVAYDLRGHGMSQAPLEPEHYTNAKLWADDVAAIIQQLGLERPVLVGWSYGGYIICDYLRAHGQDRIGAIDFAGGATKLGPAAFGTLIGPGFLDHFADFTADDLPTNIRGMRGLVAAFAATPLPADDVETLLCSAMTVPARIRANLGAREIDGDDVLRSCGCRCWSARAGRTRSCSRRWPSTSWPPARPPRPPSTRASATPPFLEDPERFNRELAALARRVSSSSSTQ